MFEKLKCKYFDKHKPETITLEGRPVNEEDCKYCGKVITQDKEGTWFAAGDII
jgi:hypothetical protein